MADQLKTNFRCPVALTDDDVVAMVAVIRKATKAANARRNRTKNTGGQSEYDTAQDAAATRLIGINKLRNEAWKVSKIKGLLRKPVVVPPQIYGVDCPANIVVAG